MGHFLLILAEQKMKKPSNTIKQAHGFKCKLGITVFVGNQTGAARGIQTVAMTVKSSDTLWTSSTNIVILLIPVFTLHHCLAAG